MSPELLAQLDANYKASQKPQPKKKQQGKGGMLTSFISEGGGAAGALGGAAAGTAILPGVGTLLGALIGGFAGGTGGRLAENKIRDNEFRVGDALKEGAISGVMGAGPGRLLKGANAIRTGGNLTEALTVGQKAAQGGTGLLGKLQTSAADKSAQGFGVKVGASAGKGKVVTPADADELTNFITNRSQQYGGIRAGKPIDQARDAQGVYNNVLGKIDGTLDNINRPLGIEELASIGTAATTKVADNGAITGVPAILNKFNQKLNGAKDLKGLEALRREYDDIAFTESGAGKTAAAAQAKAIREAIDDFITPLSPDYKAVKGDYSLAKRALQDVSKANKDPMGIPIPVPSTGLRTISVGGQGVQGFKNKINAKLAGNTIQPTTGAAKNPYKTGAVASRVGVGTPLVNALAGNTAPAVAEDTDLQALEAELAGQGQVDPTTGMPLDQALMQEPQADQNDPFNPANIQANVQQMMANGATQKDLASYLDMVQQMQDINAAANPQGKAPSAAALKQSETANAGFRSLAEIEQIIQGGGVPKGTVVAGRGMLGGLGQNVLGTASYDAAADNVADTMVRLRTGAAATKEELALYRRMLPQAFDSPDVQRQKMNAVRTYLQNLSSTPAAGIDQADLLTALGG